ncbi:MAG: hypothetical protein MJ124_00475 [Lachnospiraceae bacterium]|nr:hypothetical protein [Lachnospiraceae bacterium]
MIVPTDQKISIDQGGAVYANDVRVDTLTLYDFEDYNYLKKFGDTMYEPVNGATPKDSEGVVRQGYIEQSNVNVINQVVQLINITRAYEANQKVIQTMDSTLDQSVNNIGRV